MVIIFVGCDCTGKSTCFNMLNKPGYEKRKGSADSDPMKALEELKRDLAENKNVIHDRIPVIDDFVYSRIFSKKPSVLDSHRDEISNLLNQCLIFYFTCDYHEILDRLADRGDEYITRDTIPIIKYEYIATIKSLGILPDTIDTSDKTPIEVLNEVLEVINDEEH